MILLSFCQVSLLAPHCSEAGRTEHHLGELVDCQTSCRKGRAQPGPWSLIHTLYQVLQEAWISEKMDAVTMTRGHLLTFSWRGVLNFILSNCFFRRSCNRFHYFLISYTFKSHDQNVLKLTGTHQCYLAYDAMRTRYKENSK